MQVSTRRLKYKLKKYGVPTEYVDGWDSKNIDVYGKSPSLGVVLHHTAGTNSLNWIVNTNPYAPEVRACHFLVNRDGTVSVISGTSAYHAGAGGPYTFSRKTLPDVVIPKDSGNSALYGIEIESLGTTAAINGTKGGMTLEQVISTALLCAALLNAMRPLNLSYPVDRVIDHKTWAPGRKTDTKQDLNWWHEAVGIARRNKTDSEKTRKEIISFIKANPKGVLVVKPTPTPTPTPTPERTETGQFVVGSVPKSDPPAVVVCEVVPAKPKPAPKPKPVQPKPVVKLSDLKPRQKNASVATVQKALQKEVGLAPQATPLFNAATRAAYKKWQKSLGYTGADADGIPGRASLLKLGKKNGFTVKAT
jgi:N-acetyl-anhydromuramyl-L-alanine amidase AmpD